MFMYSCYVFFGSKCHADVSTMAETTVAGPGGKKRSLGGGNSLLPARLPQAKNRQLYEVDDGDAAVVADDALGIISNVSDDVMRGAIPATDTPHKPALGPSTKWVL